MEKFMSIQFIKRSTIPVTTSGKGKAATEPRVSITDRGVVVLNSLATKFLGSHRVGLGYDAGKIYFIKEDSKLMAKADKDKDLLPFKPEYKKAKDGTKKATGVMAYNGKDMFKSSFNEHVYDFAASGYQNFPMVADNEKGYLVFDLPKGALPKREVKKRQPRKAKTAAPATGSNLKTMGAGAGGGEDNLLDDIAS